MYSNVKSVPGRSLHERDEYILKLNNKKYNSNQTGVSQQMSFLINQMRLAEIVLAPIFILYDYDCNYFWNVTGHWSLFTTC